MLQHASSARTALLLIDIQRGLDHPTFYGSSRSNPDFEANVAGLLAAARDYNSISTRSDSKVRIIHIYHLSSNPESPLHSSNPRGVEFKDCATPVPGETVLSKTVSSAFIGTPLEELLRDEGVGQLVVCGLVTDHCVSTSVRMAENLGVVDHDRDHEGKVKKGTIVLVDDATACFAKGGFEAELVYRVSVECLRGEFAEVQGWEAVRRICFGTKV